MEAVREKKPKFKKPKEKVAKLVTEDEVLGEDTLSIDTEADSLTNEFLMERNLSRQNTASSDSGVREDKLSITSRTTHSSGSSVVSTAPSSILAGAVVREPFELIPEKTVKCTVQVIKSILPPKPVNPFVIKALAPVEAESIAAEGVTASVERVRPVESRVTQKEATAPLYPSLAEKTVAPEVMPLSVVQMKVYFVNAEARSLESTVDNFIRTNAKEVFLRHPLYNYLHEYHQALVAHETSLIDLGSLQRSYDETKERVWNITDNRVTESGYCADNRRVTGEHHYRQCHLNEPALAELGKNLEQIRELLYRTAFQHKCTAERARFQIESYLYDMVRKNPATESVADHFSILPRAELVDYAELLELRTCVGILLEFHRRPLGSEKFREDIRTWLTGCVGVLLRCSTFKDQIFLLNHLLRCPSSVLQWAAAFLQVVLPHPFSATACNDPYVKHFVTLLKCLLSPPKFRDEFLSALALDHSDVKNADSSWVVVDPDAEGSDMMRTGATMDMEENDVFLLLLQFPFNQLFAELFGPDLDLDAFAGLSEYYLLALFGFCHEFLEVLVEGLDNSRLNKYKRFNKKLSQIIRDVILHLKEFWTRLSIAHNPSGQLITKLRIQFEELVVRGFALLAKNGKSGTLQFLTGWPSKSLSLVNVWRLIVILESGGSVEVPYSGDIRRWKSSLADLHSNGKLQERIQAMDEADATYLLAAITGIVRNCDESMLDLVDGEVAELFRLSFLSPLRSQYSKTGKDLIAGICQKHPVLITEIANCVRKNLDQIGLMAVYLFQEMPLKLWKLERVGLEEISEWLVNANSVQDPSCLLAREILGNLNWGFAETGELFLPPGYHQCVAVAVVEAFHKFISSKLRKALMYESLLRLSSMITSGKATPEQQFVGWCWEVLLELKLHRMAQNMKSMDQLQSSSLVDEDVPNMTRNAYHLQSLRAVDQRQPMACFVAVMLTDVGHSTTGILEQGLDWISVLVENYLYVPALQVLETVTPLFFANNQFVYLLQQDQFHAIISGLLQADATYVRMVKNLLVEDFPGKTLKSFGNMLVHQLLHSGSNLPLAVRMWTRIFTSLKSWNRTREILYVLDQIVKFAFYSREFESVMAVFREAYEEYRQIRPIRGGTMTSLVSWMSSGSTPAYVLIDSSRLAETPWLSYAILQMETESLFGLWQNLLVILTGEKKRSFEDGLKKAAHELDLAVPAVMDLPIYRLAQVITSVSVETEIFPLLCQEFFRLFLQRSPNQASIGDQFLLSPTAVKLQKPIKQNLREAADYYKRRAGEAKEDAAEFFQSLTHVVNALSFWMDEPRLHHPNLYLPSLPPEYETELLGKVLHTSRTPWIQFVDFLAIGSMMRSQAEHWLPFDIRSPRHRTVSLCSPTRIPEISAPPPGTFTTVPPFTPVDNHNLFDSSRVLMTIRPDLTIIQNSAKNYSSGISQHVGLDINFMELIAELNVNVDKETKNFPACRKGQCAGPAEITLKFKEFTRNETVHRAYVLNREEWSRVVAEARKVDLKKLVTAVVRLKYAVSVLVESMKSTDRGDARTAEVGAILFYHILVFIGDETDEHPLTREFFRSQVEALGLSFIANQKLQCASLLDTCLNNQRAVPMLLQHFTPNIIPNEFLPMYRKIQHGLQNKNNEALMQLLSCFDVAKWLADPAVDVNSRLELLHSISFGISQLAALPSFQDHPLFEAYAHQIRDILLYRFPLHLLDILRGLLKLCEASRFPAVGWYSCSFSALNLDIQPDLDSLTADDLRKYHTVFRNFAASGRISVDMALVVIDELSSKFSGIRVGSKNARLYGLYPLWKTYLNSMAVLYATFGSVLACAEFKSDEVFGKIIALFSPWICGFTVDGQDLPPWIPADTEYAAKMLTSLQITLSIVVDKNPVVLDYSWSWFHDDFTVNRVEPYILDAVSGALILLKWEKFLPDFRVSQQYVAISESGPMEAQKFVSKVMARVAWGSVFATVREHDKKNFLPFCSNIIKVFSSFVSDSKFRPYSDGIENFWKECADFDWSFLDSAALHQSVSSLAQNPESIPAWLPGPVDEVPAIRLLSVISEVDSVSTQPTQQTVEKRAFFFHVYGRAEVAAQATKANEHVVALVHRLFQKAEAIWASAEPQIRYRGYTALCYEIFGLSNFVSNVNLDNLLRGSITVWIAQNPTSPLLVPMVAACCRAVVNMEHMARFLELIIVSYFRAPTVQDWNPIIFALEPPELSTGDFVKENLNQQNFVTLHAHYSRLMQVHASDPNKRLAVFRELIEWCKVRPAPQLQYEAKVFVLWYDVLLTIETMNIPTEVQMGMRNFTEAIFGFPEEKGGILSAIGVGKQSVLSRSFKFLARSMAVVISPLTPSGRNLGKASTLANDTRNSYESMKARKEYAQFGEMFSVVDNYIAMQGSLGWSDVRKLLGILLANVYRQHSFLVFIFDS